MTNMEIPALIAREMQIKPWQAEAVLKLLSEDNTVPFIARYRKEATGELDEEKIRLIEERGHYLHNLVKRQEEVLSSIRDQEKLTPELESAILATVKLQDLEDLYLPYRPKKRTRAQIARERGLEPFALAMLAQDQTEGDVLCIASEYINEENGVPSAEAALAGAQDIIAEMVAEQADTRAMIRKELWLRGEITTELAVEEAAAQDVLSYKEYREPVNRMPSHRILAVNRGEARELLKVHLVAPHENNIDMILRKIILQPSIFQPAVTAAVADGYKRLLFPSLEREVRSQLTENAERQAIRVFSLNLRQLLLMPPMAGQTVMGLDPGYRTGCKMAIVTSTGAVLETGVLYITMSEAQQAKAAETALALIRRHNVSLITIGNGTASYETEEFAAKLIQEHQLPVRYLIVNEAGASVYSASKLAKDELPDLDVSLRGAVSIARRVQDPLAELVKIEPKSIGVGQYQHDVNQKELEGSLTQIVESCVNHVGVELNTASPALLTYVAGIKSNVAKNIVAYRDQNGPFANRQALLKVPRLGQSTFTQCAGFLRLQQGTNPLDNTPVHPESYALAGDILKELSFSLDDLTQKEKLPAIQQALSQANAKDLASRLSAGEPTVRDIIAALMKPGRDPREDLPAPVPRKNIVKLSDIVCGSVVRGTVHNVTDFGVFVDIGVKINGLVHRSELSTKPFRHPLDVVSVGHVIDVLVLSVDEARGRIALSLKQAEKAKETAR